MDNNQNYWQRQNIDKPLFPDLFWARPEQRQLGGKLLIIGGHEGSFVSVAKAYESARQAKVGILRVLLPDKLRKTVDNFLPGAIYAPSNISGSFAQAALENWLSESDWADGVLLAGDFGKNSETAIVLEKFIQKYTGRLTITHDALDYWQHSAQPIIDRTDTAIALNLSQFQQLNAANRSVTAITADMGLTPLVNSLHDYSLQHSAHLIVCFEHMIIVAGQGRVVSTAQPTTKTISTIQVAANAAVWWLQNPTKEFESLNCAVTI
jgi:hypothetical protein